MSSYIEASAGTGKTYTITHRVLDLVKKGVNLDKILVVTFTEKATGELRHRIRELLTENKSDPNCKEALAKVDNASIHTIHSFCQRMLSEYAFEAGESLDQTMVDDEEIRTLIDEKIRDEWAEDINDMKLSQEEVEKASMMLTEASGEYFDGVDIVRPLPDYFASAQSANDLLAIPGMKDLLVDIQSDPKAGNNKKVNEVVTSLRDGNWKPGDPFMDGVGKAKFDDTDLWERVACYKNASSLKEMEKVRPAVFAFNHLEGLYKDWKAYKVKNGLQSYNDMIDRMREKVKDPAFLALLRDRFSHAIIDEFQDTNSRQWDIFKAIFLSEGHSILVVGDPKQSIYAFQGADISVYTSATINDIKVKEEPLSYNYRSTKSMIDACNAIFDTPGFKNALSYQDSSTPKDKEKAEPLYKGSPIKPLLIQDPTGDAKGFAELVARKIIEMASHGSDGRTNLQIFDKDHPENLRDVTLKDFAVLYRSRNESVEMVRAFRKYKIPFAKYKESSLFTSRECRAWISLFKALAADDFNGDNAKLLAEVYLTDFFKPGSSDHEKRIMGWRKFVAEGKYAEMLEAIYEESDIKETLHDVGRLQSLGMLQQIGDYCINYLYQRNSSLDTLISHLTALSKNEDSAADENGNLVERSSDFEAVQMMTIHAAKGLEFPVVISLVGCSQYVNQSSAFFFHDGDEKCIGFDGGAKSKYENEAKAEWNRLFYVGLTRAESLMIIPAYARDKSKAGCESVEQAFIKFVDSLKGHYIPLAVDNVDNDRTLKDWQDGLSKILSYNSNKTEGGNAEHQEKVVEELNGTIPMRIRRQHSYSSLTHHGSSSAPSVDTASLAVLDDGRPAGGTAEEIEDLTEEVADVAPEGYPRGSSLGNALHNTLEAICNGEKGLSFNAFGSALESLDPKLAGAAEHGALYELVDSMFQAEGIRSKDAERYEKWMEYSERIIWNTLNAKLSGDFKLCGLKPGEAVAEMEYDADASGHKEGDEFDALCKGFMDLVFKRDGKYYVLDWKSDLLDDYGTDSIAARVDDFYSVQRALYPYVLVKWLANTLGKDEETVFQEDFGGMYYVFLRGTAEDSDRGTCFRKWDSFDALKNEYMDEAGRKIYAIAHN